MSFASKHRPYASAATVDAFKREIIERELRATHGDATAAAARLGPSRTQMYALIEKFKLKP
jgi:DNA-binding NtrC family response regulator